MRGQHWEDQEPGEMGVLLFSLIMLRSYCVAVFMPTSL
jgi:hypothetical protein